MLILRLMLHLPASRLFQVGLVVLLWLVGEAVVRLTGLPVPGGVIGLALALILLATKWLRLDSVKRGAEWLLADMLLFFVPAVLAILDHRELLGLLGLKILAVILISTLAVMAVTALTVDLFHRLRGGHDRVSSRV